MRNLLRIGDSVGQTLNKLDAVAAVPVLLPHFDDAQGAIVLLRSEVEAKDVGHGSPNGFFVGVNEPVDVFLSENAVEGIKEKVLVLLLEPSFGHLASLGVEKLFREVGTLIGRDAKSLPLGVFVPGLV